MVQRIKGKKLLFLYHTTKIAYDFSSLQSGFCMDFTFCVYYEHNTLDTTKKIMHSNFFLLLFINVLKVHC